MSNIVKRLMIECVSRWGDEGQNRLERQAAEEIERLRASNRRLFIALRDLRTLVSEDSITRTTVNSLIDDFVDPALKQAAQ